MGTSSKEESGLVQIKGLQCHDRNQFGKAIKKLRSDNGGEFDSQEVKSWMQEEGIQWELFVAYCQDHA